MFHCKVCDKGLSTVAFIATIFECSYESAAKINKAFETQGDLYSWTGNTELPNNIKELCNSLGIKDNVIEELNIRSEDDESIAFPVFMYDKLVDVRTYRPKERANKIKSRVGSTSGLIIPYDLWLKAPENKWTILCAGEKDMAVTRSQGLNAITLTGGEKALPKVVRPFRGKKIAICYDNDEAGISGAKALAAFLKPYVNEVRVITKFHEVCVEHGEDLTDYFVKYKKTKEDLVECIKNVGL